MIRAAQDAASTSCTAFLLEHQLSGKALGFRIMAPGAGKRAAFKKYRGSNSFAVMDGIFLYVRNERLLHSCFSFKLCFKPYLYLVLYHGTNIILS
jgi:hypothetical protein